MVGSFEGVDVISARVTRIKGDRIETYFNIYVEDFRRSLRKGLLPYTTLEKDGDNYVINGTKIWTTYAQYANWIFCLVRTTQDTKPQKGMKEKP